MKQVYNVLIEQDEEGWFISEVVGLPGCHTQAKSLDELMKRTKELVVEYMEAKKGKEIQERFIGLQQIEV
ncbi:MAG: type II toxin-antitoxin system HicB family antitoxin [Candidatus Aenigmarchaeota archaeon]|nr:type II toxin-antitoxin system HicB family antitoxin [Candidatus Aenigmarchaeota archaeon]MDI6722696.1 type II toxin-antitoxin system HicB family antitoxin [Candidatus Aenigmarchaeota archaeon]